MWLLILLVALIALPQIVYGCSDCQPCYCTSFRINYYRSTCTVNCSSLGLENIPGNLPFEVNILDLSNNNLTSDALYDLTNITDSLISLNLSNNALTYIPSDTVSRASILEELILDGNILEQVNSSSFGFLKQLQKLVGIRSLYFANDTFKNLIGLDELSISFDSENISDNIFSPLKIITLDVEFTMATFIPTHIFRFGVDTLLDLKITAPEAEKLHVDTFSGLTILKSITLIARKMHTLPSFIFHGNSVDDRKMPVNLARVVIKGVKSLPRNLFNKQQSLKFLALNDIDDLLLSNNLESQIDTLDLSGSSLYSIKADLLENFKSLRFLNMSNTKIERVDKDSFSMLSSLTGLDMSKNYIANLPAGLFTSCRNTLASLNISHNQIQNITNDTFALVKALQRLDMGNNRIKHIDSYAFKDLYMLSDLSLNDNELVYLSENSLMHQRNLLEANFARNKIQHFPRTLFRNAQYLKRLDISGNKIQTLSIDFFSSVKHLEFVSLDENPVHCDCSLMLLKDKLPRVELVGNCNEPPSLFGTKLADLKLNTTCLEKMLLDSAPVLESSVSLIQGTENLEHIPVSIISTTYEAASRVINIESTPLSTFYHEATVSFSPGYILPTMDSDIDHARSDNDFYNSFVGTSAFYIAIGCAVTVCGGACIGFIIYRIRRRIRSRAYEVTETNNMTETIELDNLDSHRKTSENEHAQNAL